MKPHLCLAAGISLTLFTSPKLLGEEPPPNPEIDGLRKTSADFVLAFNKKDPAALAALFAENGEISDSGAEEIVTGRDEIKTHYEKRFADGDVPEAAVEVASVRLVTPTVAIEDGTFHLDPPGDDTPVQSTTYTAVLAKNAAGTWEIASTRDLADVSEPAEHLTDLAEQLKGDWTGSRDGLRVDLAFGWDDTGNFITGEMQATESENEPQTTTIRFGWDGRKENINCWTFDSGGGFAKAVWTEEDDGWTVRTEGTTADGESMSANQRLVFKTKDEFVWTGTNRLIDGEKQPDTELRIVRQAPEPADE